MTTFECHEACSKLCESNPIEDFTFQVSYLYPGLTTSERSLVSQYPKEALLVFNTKLTTETLCRKMFGDNRTNDESDACRHYVWSALTVKELKRDLTEKFLNAHEDTRSQPPEEKAMDVANNRLGLLKGESLIKNNEFSERKILQEFESALKRNEIIVLSPSPKK